MNTSIYSRQWDVGSFTDSTKKPYKVSERRDGRWECSCPAWTRHTPRTDCKHIVKVQESQLLLRRKILCSSPLRPLKANRPYGACNQPAERAVIIDGYAIRRRALDDTLTDADDATTARRSHREI